MPRYFTLPEAERLLPEVDRILRDAIAHRAEAARAERELNQALQKIRMAGGSRVSPGPILATRARRDTAAAGLEEALERIQELGAQVKDLDIGLIDFMTRYQGRDVCLCWKIGEDRIQYWHGAQEGYRGRKLIDDEFLKLHRGEPTQ
jgi:hypothetical protein